MRSRIPIADIAAHTPDVREQGPGTLHDNPVYHPVMP